jgi:REP element-mobilizing transposase RayT
MITIRRRRLPHWAAEEATYFVTFRLHDALPRDLAFRISTRRGRHRLADRFLDRSFGCCWLKVDGVARVVDSAIRFFDRNRYLLHAWTIMPNHVHVAFRLLTGMTLARVMQGLKGFTAREANRVLKHRGAFWQAESFDSLLHDQNDLDRVIAYIVRNPVRARLMDWPWTTVLRTEFDGGAGWKACATRGIE